MFIPDLSQSPDIRYSCRMWGNSRDEVSECVILQSLCTLFVELCSKVTSGRGTANGGPFSQNATRSASQYHPLSQQCGTQGQKHASFNLASPVAVSRQAEASSSQMHRLHSCHHLHCRDIESSQSLLALLVPLPTQDRRWSVAFHHSRPYLIKRAKANVSIQTHTYRSPFHPSNLE